jgi:hypothetical protein
MAETITMAIFGFLTLCVITAGFFGIGFLYKNYNVWSQEMTGKANLAEAEWSKKIAVEEAKAREESAVLDARAEVARAKGVRESNEIIAEGLGGPEGYLRYLYINTLNDLDTQLIYVPTEAGLPILEAGKR